MTPTKSLDFRLLFDYLADDCTPEQRVHIEQWAAGHPVRQTLLRNLMGLSDYVAQRRKPQLDVDAFVHRLMAQVATDTTTLSVVQTRGDQDSPVTNVSRSAARKNPLEKRAWRNLGGVRAPLLHRAGYLFAGAAAVILMMFGYIHLTAHARTPRRVTTYATANAQRANITLPDGSRVTLDVGSRLDVPSDYGIGNRTLILIGEALFTVPNHTNQPFQVIAGKTTTEVLGTSFVIRHYTTDTTTNVAVRDGKVSVRRDATRPIVLASMQQADIGQAHDWRVSTVDPSRFTFATGVLQFKDTPLSEVIVELGRWYDVEIRLDDATLAGRYVTGGFLAGSRADLAELLALPLGVRVVQNGRIFTLYRR